MRIGPVHDTGLSAVLWSSIPATASIVAPQEQNRTEQLQFDFKKICLFTCPLYFKMCRYVQIRAITVLHAVHGRPIEYQWIWNGTGVMVYAIRHIRLNV